MIEKIIWWQNIIYSKNAVFKKCCVWVSKKPQKLEQPRFNQFMIWLISQIDISKQIIKGELHTYFRCHGPSNSFYSKYLKSLYWVIEPLHQYNSVPFMTNPFSPCKKRNWMFSSLGTYTVVSVTLSGILKAKQKLGITFNFDKQDVIDFTIFSKMTMCRASEANS